MHKILKYPKVILAVIGMITIYFSFFLPRIQLDNDVKKFLPDEHIVNIENDREEELFGSSHVLAIALENTRGSILDRQFIDNLRGLSEYLLTLEGVEDVDDLTNTDYINAIPGGMEVADLTGDDFTGTADELKTLKNKLLSWDVYERSLYSRDFTATQLAVTLETDISPEAQEAVYYSAKAYLEELSEKNIRYYIAGDPSVMTLITLLMQDDLKVLIPLVLLVLIFFLYISFRKLGGVLLPLSSVIISTVWTVGLMAQLGIPLSIVATAIPVLMVAVGSAYGIHVVSHYYDELELHCDRLDHDEHVALVLGVVKSIGLPVMTASLTTIAGFASLASSSIIPLRNFGLFTALGVFVAMLVSLLFIPSVLILRRRSPEIREHCEESDESATASVFLGVSRFLGGRKSRLIVFFAAVVGLSVYGTFQVVVDNALIEYFKPDAEIRQADVFMRDKFLGTETFNIVVEGEEAGDLTDPVVLAEMDKLALYLKDRYSVVSKVMSFSDFVRRMNQVMNDPAGMEDFSDDSWDREESVSGGDESFGSFDSFDDGGSDEDDLQGFGFGEAGFGGDSGFGEGFGDEDGFGFSDFSEGSEDPLAGSAGTPGYRYDDRMSYGDFLMLLEEVWNEADHAELTAESLVTGIYKKLNYGGAAYNEIPLDPGKYNLRSTDDLKNLISQYLMIYSGNLEDYADDAIEPRIARMGVTLKTTGSRIPHRIMEDVEGYGRLHFPEGVRVWTTGMAKSKYAVTELVVGTQITSVLLSLLLVLIIVSVQFRSIVAGLISVIPLSISILINFGVMGLFGIKLDIGTSIVASVAIGVGVDYTIHFLTGYYQQWQKTPEHRAAVQATWGSVGKAIIFNALSVAAGFFVLVFSNFNPLMFLGELIVLTMLTSSLGALTILPALLKLLKPGFLNRNKK